MECLSKKHLLDPCLQLIELKMKIQRNKAEILINKIHVYKAGRKTNSFQSIYHKLLKQMEEL